MLQNKTLIGLSLVILILSLAGAFAVLNKLGTITGFQANVTSQQGTTSAQVLGTAQITLYNASMQFGSGQINGTYSINHDFCSLYSNGSINSANNNFAGGTDFGSGGKSAECVGTGWLTPWSFVIENTGNTDFNNLTMATLGGNAGFQANFTSAVTNGSWQWRLEEEAAAACSGAVGQTATWTAVNASAIGICTTFKATPNTADAIMLQMNITIPEDAPARTWSDNVTFTAIV